jgi:hypothetical protein
MVRVERLISLAMARIDPPALLASWTAARISASASLMRRAALCRRRRCVGGMAAGFRPGFIDTGES